MSVPLTVDIVIKLGGSAITEKSQFETFKEAASREAVKLIKLCVNKGLKVVVVHGAGSFGHQHAKDYGVQGGWMNDSGGGSRVKNGFSLTRVSCLKLHARIVEELTNQGLPAVGLSPCGKWTTHGGEVVQSGVSTVCSFLIAGFIPVLHGDCVMDTFKGCNILSGDTVIKTVCKEMPVKRVVFLADVAGIYDRPPNMPDAKLIPKVTVDENGKMTQDIKTDVLSSDVTGGIELKLRTAIDIVLQSKGTIPVFVCQVGSVAAESACIEGEQPSLCRGGTVVTLHREN